MPVPEHIPTSAPEPSTALWSIVLTLFGPFILSGLMAFCAQLFKQLVKIPREALGRIILMSIGAAVMAVAAHAVLTDTTPLSDTTLIGIAGIFGYIGAAGIERAMTYNIRKRTGIDLAPSDPEAVAGGEKNEPDPV